MLFRILTWLVLSTALIYMLVDLGRMGTPGWDESAHSIVALRIAAIAQTGDLLGAAEVFCGVDRYPPLGRGGMALGFLAGGPGWGSPRAATAVAFILSVALASMFSRRLVRKEQGDIAALLTALFGLSGWLGVAHASTAMIEPWAGLAMIVAVGLFVRGWESGGRRDGILAGAAIAANALVKYNYVIFLYLAIAGALFGAWIFKNDEKLGETGTLRRRLGFLGWTALGFGIVSAWWFVLPLPLGLDAGQGHWALFIEFLTVGGGLAGGRESRELIYILPILGFGSILIFALHVGGLLLAVKHRGSMAWRLSALLAVAGPAALAIYPYREERFLVPTLVLAWPLGGAACANLLGRFRGVKLWGLTAALVAVLALTAGLGSTWLVRLAKPQDWKEPDFQVYGAFLTRRVRNPYAAFKRAPGDTRRDRRQWLFDVAVEKLDPTRSYCWIGGTSAELPVACLSWQLYQKSRLLKPLVAKANEMDPTLVSKEWSEVRFVDWVRQFDQVMTVDPPPPSMHGFGPLEKDLVAWMKTHPGFEVDAVENVADPDNPAVLTFYRRKIR